MEFAPTTYAGITFRNRTVAQWACFLDALSIRWCYKPETVPLSRGTSHSPDFWLPDRQAWLDILSDQDHVDPEQTTAVDLHRITGKTVLLFIGFPAVMTFLSNSDDTSVQEICNFGIKFVNQKHPTRCTPIGASTLNEAMQFVLGMLPSTDRETFRVNTMRLSSAANRSNSLFRDKPIPLRLDSMA